MIAPGRQQQSRSAILLVVATCAFIFTAPSVRAETEKVLIPVVASQVPGAYGSIWQSDVWVQNLGDQTRTLDANQICLAQCPPNEIGPLRSQGVPLIGQPGSNPGVLIYVDKPAADLSFYLTVRDESRAHQTWGTEFRAIRESEALTGRSVLLNLPTDPKFRVRVRIYDFDGRPDARLLVRVFSAFKGLEIGVLGTAEILLTPPTSSINTDAKYKPGFGQISDVLLDFPAARSAGRLGVEIVPLTPGLRYWAFATVTHEETQFVTIINPR